MRYFVTDQQGQQYGPADVSLLNQWAAQGRVAPMTILVEEGTGRQVAASSVPGLMLVSPDQYAASRTAFASSGIGTSGGPFGSMQDDGSWEAKRALNLAGVSLALCFPVAGIFPSIGAIRYAAKASAKGARNASMAMLAAVVSLVLQFFLLWIIYRLFFA